MYLTYKIKRYCIWFFVYTKMCLWHLDCQLHLLLCILQWFFIHLPSSFCLLCAWLEALKYWNTYFIIIPFFIFWYLHFNIIGFLCNPMCLFHEFKSYSEKRPMGFTRLPKVSVAQNKWSPVGEREKTIWKLLRRSVKHGLDGCARMKARALG